MTTKVKVTAQCGEDVEVVIEVSSPNVGQPLVILQNGESYEEYCYEERVIIVRERQKNPDATAQLGGGNKPKNDN